MKENNMESRLVRVGVFCDKISGRREILAQNRTCFTAYHILS